MVDNIRIHGVGIYVKAMFPSMKTRTQTISLIVRENPSSKKILCTQYCTINRIKSAPLTISLETLPRNDIRYCPNLLLVLKQRVIWQFKNHAYPSGRMRLPEGM